MSHILVVANETVAGPSLIESLKRRAADGADLVTVLAPISHPNEGYVVYDDTRRAAAGRRLDRTLSALREAGISAHGLVVEVDPADAVRDAIAMLDPKPTEIIVSTHPKERSGWMRRKVIDRIRDAAKGLPVEHVVVDLTAEGGEANVLVIANETVVGDPLLARIRERAERSPASFLIISPQSDPNQAEHPEAERRLRRALAILRGEGIDAHGQVSHPDPYTAAMQAVHDERIDEIIVSTFAPERSPWLRKNLVQRLHNDSKLPVEHVVPPARRRRSSQAQPGRGSRSRRSASRPTGGQSELAGRLDDARDAPLHRLGDHALRLVLHGLLLRPGRERRPRVAAASVPPAGLRRRGEHGHPPHLELHDALGAAGDQAREPRRDAGGLVLTLALGLTFLLTQAREYSRIGFAPHDGAFGSVVLRADGPARSARLRRADAAHVRDGARLPRPLHA